MTSGPLPPHERSWRHPSELPPPVPEPTSRSGRVLIVSAATLSLVLIGMMALSITPDRLEPSGQGVGSGVVITLGRPVMVGGGSVAGASAAEPTGAGPPQAEPVPPAASTTLRSARTTDALLSTLPRSPAPVSSGWVDPGPASDPATTPPPSDRPPATAALAVLTTSPYPVVTPFGVDGMALTTGRAVGDRTDSFAVSLPSGEVTDAHVVAVAGDVAVVELCDCNTAYRQYQMAPSGDTVPEHVVVMADGADIVVEPTSLAAMQPQEGAPVMDLTGRVIGLYTYGPPAADQTGAVLGVANVVAIVDDLPPPTTEAVATSDPLAVDATTMPVSPTDVATTAALTTVEVATTTTV